MKFERVGAVHLIRHGEVANPDHVVYASLPGYSLNSTGRTQAEACAARLADEPVGLVISSPLERAAATAEAVAARHGLTVVTDERLTEWRLSERWSGVAWEDLPQRFPGELEAYLDRPDELPFTPETLEELAARMVEAIEEHHARDDTRDLVVVGHQDPVQAARLVLTGRALSRLHTRKPGHGSVATLISNIAGDSHSDADWIEARYWEPDQGAPFPPSGA